MNLRRAFTVWQRHFVVYKKLYRYSIVLNFVEPALYLVALGLGLGGFVKEVNGVPYINFLAPGFIASSSMFAATYECTYGTYIRMTFQKTFDAILSTPVNLEDLVAGELMWGASKSMFYGTVIMTTISLFGLVDSALILFVIPVLFVSGLLFAQLSMICAALVPGIDSFNYYYTLFMTPMFLFSGIFFPLDSLPRIVSQIAFFTPLYHLANICRSLSSGHVSGIVSGGLWLCVAALILSPLPFRLMRQRIIK